MTLVALKSLPSVRLHWPARGAKVRWNPATGRNEPANASDKKACGSWLKEQRSFGDGSENLLIHGENAEIMEVLMATYAGRVKLIYSDPPFNTGRTDFAAYDDALDTSVWLSMMEERLRLACDLLRPDGTIAIHIGTGQAGNLRALMDEIFGAENFLNQICVAATPPSGFRITGAALLTSANYILLYAKDRTQRPLTRLYRERNYDFQYRYFLENREDSSEHWHWRPVQEVVAEKLGFRSPAEARRRVGADAFKLELAKLATRDADRVFRLAVIRGGARQKRLTTITRSLKYPGRVFIHPGENLRDFYILNGNQMLFYDRRLAKVNGQTVPAEPLSDIWADIPWTGIASEGGVRLKDGKKPETLLARVINLGSSPGDLVLDFFGGSGTTAAVAHKLDRQWISIEASPDNHRLSRKRLQRVINGTDTSGIAKTIRWTGGGGFRELVMKAGKQAGHSRPAHVINITP